MRRCLPAILFVATAAAPAPTLLVAARPIARGATLTEADVTFAPMHGLMLGALVDPAQAIGRVARRALAPGVAVRADALADLMLVKRGDPVILRAGGRGFTVEARGAASADGSEGTGVAVVNSATGARLRGAVSADGVIAIGLVKVAGERP